jgi:hypothetical protein
MDALCLLHNNRTCGKRKTIDSARSSNTVRVAYAYDWGSHSDNSALIYEEVQRTFLDLRRKFPGLEFSFNALRGKDGSIYCDICRQLRSADIVLCDISTHNSNVVLELGLAIGSGTYVFVLRSTHYRRRKGLSDLDGVLEYRFSKKDGQMNFQADFRGSLKRKLTLVSKRRMRSVTTKGVPTKP